MEVDKEAAADAVRMAKYFREIRMLPKLEGRKTRSQAAAFQDDLRIFIDKWSQKFEV